MSYINKIFVDNEFMKNFYDVMLSPGLINIATGLTVAISFTEVVGSINNGVILPILSRLSKNKQPFKLTPIISSIFMFILVSLLVYTFILLPINKLRTSLNLNDEYNYQNNKNTLY